MIFSRCCKFYSVTNGPDVWKVWVGYEPVLLFLKNFSWFDPLKTPSKSLFAPYTHFQFPIPYSKLQLNSYQTWLLNSNVPNVPHQKLKNFEKIQFVPFHMLLFGEKFLKSAKNPQKICAYGAKSKMCPKFFSQNCQIW